MAETAKQALGLLMHERFDAVLSDKNLPDGDGAEICRAARRRNPTAALIVLTGYASARSAEEFLQLDVDDYIAKPFDIDVLLRRVASALARRRTAAATVRPVAAKGVAPHHVLIVEATDADRGAVKRALEKLGCEVVVAPDALAALEGQPALAGAIIDRKLCTDEVRAEILRHKMANPAFRLVVTIDNKALNETVASILVGAVGQLARPIGDDEARSVLAPIFGGLGKRE